MIPPTGAMKKMQEGTKESPVSAFSVACFPAAMNNPSPVFSVRG